jgi:hypothetical protein
VINKYLGGVCVLSLAVVGCNPTGEYVGPGKAALLMELYGEGRGVKNAEIFEGGKVIVPPGKDLMIYPISYFNAVFTQDTSEGAPKDQRINFSASGGSNVGVDMSVSFSWSIEQMEGKPKGYTRLHEFVSKYNQEPSEFVNSTLFTATRDCATKSAADQKLGAAAILGNVQPLLEGTKTCLASKFPELVISNVGSLGRVVVDKSIQDIINAQFTAQQGAITAEANAARAKADGAALLAEATAKANAAVEEARGKAEADRLRSASTTPQILELRRLEVQLVEANKWNGVRPSTIIQTGNAQVGPQ